MSVSTKLSGVTLAAAAATLFMAAPLAHASDKAESKTGHCMGANACKGTSACKTASNACKGQNACKGTGFTEATKEACAEAGGKFEKPGK